MSKFIILVALLCGIYWAFGKQTSHSYDVSVIAGPNKQTLIANRLADDNQAILEEPVRLREKYVAVYYTASWCPPCRQFTPMLVEFYNSQPRISYELITVNMDRSKEDMVKYIRDYKINWPVLGPQADKGVFANPPSGRGIPNLVIIERVTGKVVAESYENGNYVGPMQVLKKLAELNK